MTTVIIPHLLSILRFLGRPRLLTRIGPHPGENPRHGVATLNGACQPTGAGDAEICMCLEVQSQIVEVF